MAIKIEMLRCFAAVASHGSLADAALALGRTPSAVSMMLKQFEDHIGTPLFETARKSRLTPIGVLIHQEARREVAHFENTVGVIEGLARSQLGFLRLAVTPSVATSILPPVILAYTRQFPGVQIDLRDMDSASITDELWRERADIGIGTMPPTEGMTRTELFSDPFGVICRQDHDLARDWHDLTWRDLADDVFIANGLCEQITDPEFAPILKGSRLRVPNTASLLGLVREGVGITLLPQLAFDQRNSDLAFLPLKDATARRKVHLMTRPASCLLPAAQSFVALIRELADSGALVYGAPPLISS